MKSILALVLLIIACKTQAQNVLHFDNSLELHITIEEFNMDIHTVDTCYFDNTPYICKIDEMEWYGTDMGLELPKYQLEEVIVIHNGEKIKLDVTQMFNPVFSKTITERHFQIESVNGQFSIYGWFSDGAGTYCAKWLVKGGSSKRTLLSNSEADCFE